MTIHGKISWHKVLGMQTQPLQHPQSDSSGIINVVVVRKEHLNTV